MNFYVSAYLDKNLGDDLMLWLLCTHFPEHSFHLYCVNPEYFPVLPDCKNLLSTEVPLKVVLRSRDNPYDGYLRIGGSLFEMKGVRTPVYRFLHALQLESAMRRGFKSAVIGCNISTFPSTLAQLTTKKEFRTFGLATVRDQRTFRFASALKAPEHLFFYPDMLFSLPSSFFPSKKGPDGPLGVAVYRSKYLPEENSRYYDVMAAFCDLYIEKNNRPVHFFAFDTGLENDNLAAQEIQRRMTHAQQTALCSHNGHGWALLAEMSKCSAMVCTRFHAIVLAMLMHIPFVPISYSEKTDNLLCDIGYEGVTFTFTGMRDTTPEALLRASEKLDYSVSAATNDLNVQAEGHMRQLKAYFGL